MTIVPRQGHFQCKPDSFGSSPSVSTTRPNSVTSTAAVIIGETLLPRPTVAAAVLGCILGSVFYRLVVAVALGTDFMGLQASDLNLVTAVIVGAALILPAVRGRLRAAT